MTSLWRTWLAGVLVAVCAVALSGQEFEPVTVTVNNTTSVVNGDTSSIPALMAAPGADGISFREALAAVNVSDGIKVIKFATELTGRTIDVTTSNDQVQLFAIDTPNLTIDGDIDGNGTPDITFVAARDSTFAFLIRSSRVSIRGIGLNANFSSAVIVIGCADLRCDLHSIGGIEITGNEIVNTQGSGISIGPESVKSTDILFVPDLVIENVVVSGNTITTGDAAITIGPSVDAVSGAIARNIRIEDNRIGSTTGIRAIAAHRISPPRFGDNNTIQNLSISGNTIEARGTAILIAGADYGNSNNRVTGLQITSNHITGSKSGIEVVAAMDGKPQRVASGNVIDDVTIASNEIKATARGITLSAADLPLPETDGAGFDSNRIQNASIRDNTISSYTEAGVQLWAGFANTGSFSLTISRNSLQFISVTNNTLDASPLKKGTGIAVFGGDARSGATSRENTIRGLTISGNRASGNAAGVTFIGGNGSQSRANTIDVVNFNANVLGANDVAVTAVENLNSASGNAVRFPRRRAVR